MQWYNCKFDNVLSLGRSTESNLMLPVHDKPVGGKWVNDRVVQLGGRHAEYPHLDRPTFQVFQPVAY